MTSHDADEVGAKRLIKYLYDHGGPEAARHLGRQLVRRFKRDRDQPLYAIGNALRSQDSGLAQDAPLDLLDILRLRLALDRAAVGPRADDLNTELAASPDPLWRFVATDVLAPIRAAHLRDLEAR